MKKISLFVVLAGLLVIAGCGSSSEKSNTTTGEFAVDTCNKYFELVECTIKDIPEDQKEIVLQDSEFVKEQWKALPEEELQPICDTTWEQVTSMADVYESLGCSVN
ncbi:MAG: DUF5339 family protein [Candidatus Peribacteria bacterium]|jgi:hypothetical protein|nr:DUF5339 family protein [Candidatus Peribacteria bacterium]